MKSGTELLAPAGSFEIFRAVMKAGADAVYAGSKRFSARAYADNFTDAEIMQAMDEAHLHGCRFYLALNTLIKDAETDEALRTVERFYEGGLDAVIVQDFGLAVRIGQLWPDLELHGSTQMTVCGTDGLRLLEEYGFTQAVLPRELSLQEIRQIVRQTNLRTECFVHGALCYCYSGKCLLSSVIGGRSANRGKCAQPCRLPYTLQGGGTQDGRMYGKQSGRAGADRHHLNRSRHRSEKQSTGESDQETYLLSLKDLCAAGSIGQLIDAGVYSFKIEGRMKGIEYAAGVTQSYRELIDRVLEERAEDSGTDQSLQEHLTALGSRSGFTNGYLLQEKRRMVTMEQPSHHRDDESAYVREVREKYASPPEKIPVRISAVIRPGEAPVLKMCAQGHEVTVTGDPVQTAAARPLTEETVREKLTKLGGTPFICTSWRMELASNSFLPVSQLNRMRQQAAEELTASFRPVRAAAGSGHRQGKDVCAADRQTRIQAVSSGPDPMAACGTGSLPQTQEDLPDLSRTAETAGPLRLTVSVMSARQLDAVLCFPQIGQVILDEETFRIGSEGFSQAVRKIHAAGAICIAAMPHTFRPQTASHWEQVLLQLLQTETRPDALPDGYLLRCIDEAAFCRRLYRPQDHPDCPARSPLLIADGGLYTWNDAAVRFLQQLGIAYRTVPYELSARELEAQDTGGAILTIYGRIPLMVSAQCVSYHTDTCRYTDGGSQENIRQCGSSGTQEAEHDFDPAKDSFVILKDRKGKAFPVRQLCGSCGNVIYNCVPTDLMADAAQIRRMGFAGFRMDFTTETPEQTTVCMRRFAAFAAGKIPQKPQGDFTRGAWRRGTQ